MDTNAKILAVPPIVPAASPSSSSGEFSQGRAAKEVEQALRYRLIIEEGPAPGIFVYKTLDSVTGQVVRQFPREEVLRLSESGDYSAGAVIDTSA